MTDQPELELTDDPAIPVLEEQDEPPKPPVIDHRPVPGAADLPEHVKSGDISPDSDDGSDIHTEDPA